MTPPNAGPKLRAMLKLTLFNALALGSSAGVTCSPTDACHEGPNRALPLPTRKVNRRRLADPTWPPKTDISIRQTVCRDQIGQYVTIQEESDQRKIKN